MTFKTASMSLPKDLPSWEMIFWEGWRRAAVLPVDGLGATKSYLRPSRSAILNSTENDQRNRQKYICLQRRAA